MPPLPSTDFVIQDGGLGLLPEAVDGLHVKIGTASSGSANTLLAFSDPTDVATTFGQGPLVRSMQHCLNTSVQGRSARPIYAIRPAGSIAGATGPVVKTPVTGGTGTGTVSAAGAAFDRYDARIKITRAGTLGAGAFQVSLDGGDVYAPEVTIPGGGTYLIPNTNVTLTFTAGGGPAFFEVGDVFTFTTLAPAYNTTDLATTIAALFADVRTWGFIHILGPPAPAFSSVTSTGTTPPAVTLTGAPIDFYDVRVDIILGGARGTATFQYSLNGGTSYNGVDILTAATYDIPGTGITLNFATGTYNADNLYSFDTGNAAGLATLAAAVKTHVDAAEAQGRYIFAVLETGAPDAALVTAMASFTSLRVGAVPAFVECPMPDGKIERRPQAWPMVARIAAIPVQEDPGRRASGALGGVKTGTLSRDERKTPNLDAARFMTLMTDLDLPGIHVANANLFAPPGSDFAEVMNRRVMDKACRLGRVALKRFQSDELLVKASDGTLLETEARRVEGYVDAAIRAGMMSGRKEISEVTVECVRTNNILSTRQLLVRIRIVPVGYAKTILATIAFSNPALTQAAA